MTDTPTARRFRTSQILLQIAWETGRRGSMLARPFAHWPKGRRNGSHIAEQGPHDAQLAAGGTHARLIHSQAMRYQPNGRTR